MNDRAINTGGWPATSMRTFINADIYNSLPSILQSGIIETSVVTGYGYNDNKTNLTSKDKLYLLSAKEIYSDWSETYDSAINLTRQLDYYKNATVAGTIDSVLKRKKGSLTDAPYWTRSIYNSTNFYYLGNSSTDVNNSTDLSYAIFFRLEGPNESS